MKGHMKRVSAPKTWDILKKSSKFVTRAKPGTASQDMGVPLSLLLKDMLNIASTRKDVKRIMKDEIVEVDGKRRKEFRYSAGFMSVVSLPKHDKHYRIMLNKFGKIYAQPIEKKESGIKLLKVADKRCLKKGKVQVNFSDGTNIIVKDPKDYKRNDVLIVEVPKLTVKKHLKLEKGANVILTRVKYSGSSGAVKEIAGKNIIISKGEKEMETSLEYAFVVGNPEPEIKLME